ncbi:hypothetical protein DLM77_21260 [Leptospira yasudae]|uniref:Intein C-terminal splicing domain-containing protein n=1 Tax=Leptospira yasudae TaxID=2202201 RepID=A0ABX9LX17_9LEPT|nr:hypothetical protein DLM77_21260 [Leptospira yasudae]
MVNERSWVKVKDLKVGDIVQLQDGSSVPITGITPYSLSMTPVYNLEVEENHTYYVGQEGVLVHNYDPSTYKGNVGTELLLGGGGGGSSTGLGLAAFFTAMQNFFGSDGNPNENKPQTPALPRDPSLTQNEAEQMHRLGLNPLNSSDIQKYKYASNIAKNTILNATTNWADLAKLLDHVQRHGADFGTTSPFEYAQKATDFLKNAKANGYEVRIGGDGITRVYDPQTNTLGSYNLDGTTRTFYKPSPMSETNTGGYDPNKYYSPLDYWNKAPINQGIKPW